MADLTALSVSSSLIQPTAGAQSATELAKRGQIKDTAQKFESSFLSVMLGQMFEGTDAPSPFGGGPGEAMFKSFLTEAMAKKMSDSGGIGVAASVQREMLKMQGLS
jgi:Rod binding domain-containing protein